MLELMSASEMKCRQPDFRSWRGPRHDSRTDRQLLGTSDTKASDDGAQKYLREKHDTSDERQGTTG
jgi:hypothetical protein